jgi:hypothetical protein
MAIAKHFLDQKLKKTLGSHQTFSRFEVHENTWWLVGVFCIKNV